MSENATKRTKQWPNNILASAFSDCLGGRPKMTSRTQLPQHSPIFVNWDRLTSVQDVYIDLFSATVTLPFPPKAPLMKHLLGLLHQEVAGWWQNLTTQHHRCVGGISIQGPRFDSPLSDMYESTYMLWRRILVLMIKRVCLITLLFQWLINWWDMLFWYESTEVLKLLLHVEWQNYLQLVDQEGHPTIKNSFQHSHG